MERPNDLDDILVSDVREAIAAGSSNLDEVLVSDIRKAAFAGASVLELVVMVLERTGQTASINGGSMPYVLYPYFCRGFRLSIHEMHQMRDWHRFPGGTYSDAELERVMRPLVERGLKELEKVLRSYIERGQGRWASASPDCGAIEKASD